MTGHGVSHFSGKDGLLTIVILDILVTIARLSICCYFAFGFIYGIPLRHVKLPKAFIFVS